MSQRAFLDDFCSDIADAFADVGLCDTALYTPPVDDETPGAPAPSPIACRVFMDDDVQQADDMATYTGPRTTATFLRSEIPNPQPGGTLVVDGRTFRLDCIDGASGYGSRSSALTTAEVRWVLLPLDVEGSADAD